MAKDRVALTIRVSESLKFQIDKAVMEDKDCTINSWVVNLIKRKLENRNVKK